MIGTVIAGACTVRAGNGSQAEVCDRDVVLRAACVDKMTEDIAYLSWILDDGNDLHLPSALGTDKRIDFIDLRE